MVSRKKIAEEKHSSLISLSVSDEGKTFYNPDVRSAPSASPLARLRGGSTRGWTQERDLSDSSQGLTHRYKLGVRYPTGDNLKVVWAEFSTLS
jgi:hypothetical protein